MNGWVSCSCRGMGPRRPFQSRPGTRRHLGQTPPLGRAAAPSPPARQARQQQSTPGPGPRQPGHPQPPASHPARTAGNTSRNDILHPDRQFSVAAPWSVFTCRRHHVAANSRRSVSEGPPARSARSSMRDWGNRRIFFLCPRLTTTHGSSPASALRMMVVREVPRSAAVCATLSMGCGAVYLREA